MGIYYEYGIEYNIRISDDLIHVVTIRQADQRFLESDYYQRHKLQYQELAKTPWYQRAMDCDVQLTESEKTVLQNYLEHYGNSVIEHGWFDVCRMQSSILK